MLRPLTFALIGALALTGCARLAESRLNPLNWFGRAEPVAAAAQQAAPPPLVPADRRRATVDNRLPVEEITALAVERTRDGAILRATGLAAAPGFFNAQLVPTGQDGGILTYEMRAEQPPRPVAGGPAARRITVATTLSAQELAGVRVIRVQGLRNALETRR